MDDVVEDAAEPYFESSISSTCRQRIPAHDGGCASILFEYKSSKLISGGQDREIKICGTFRSNANRVASNGSRSCISADDGYVTAGSVDGSVHIWSNGKNIERTHILCT